MTDHDDCVITRDGSPVDADHPCEPVRWSPAATLARALGTAPEHPGPTGTAPDADDPRD